MRNVHISLLAVPSCLAAPPIPRSSSTFFSSSMAFKPAGLKAMEELKKVEEERGMGGAARQEGTASNEMCTFLIINISSLQLIPMNMIAYRSQYGSVNPTAIVGPALAATFISTVVAVIFCRIMDR